ncbi:PREDICTED: intracellular protein transport protein USO1-like [Nicrophorus vespilloides]|uniref:Intracellular protein transport protein USO1-like n=1 Tax=Nicrophorus vespilloides TaxID=110193 RepID=A0ABM1M097_NICVS|nr:PREDICTED: intracellular protein transport protein USO1-like [Nicrophorus vespilloides]
MADIWDKFKEVCPEYKYSKEETTVVLPEFLRFILKKVHTKALEVCSANSEELSIPPTMSNINLIKQINELIPSTDFKLSILSLVKPKTNKVTHVIRYLMHLVCACYENGDDFKAINSRTCDLLETEVSLEQERKALLIENHNHTIEEMKAREAIGQSKSNIDRMNNKYLSVVTSEDFKTNSNNIKVVKEAIATKTDRVEKLKESIKIYQTNETELNEVQANLCKIKNEYEEIKVECASLDNVISLKQKHYSYLQSVSDIATTFSTFVQDFKHISTSRKELQKKVEINADLKTKLEMTEMQIVDKISVMNDVKDMYIKNYRKQMQTYVACSTKLEGSKGENERIQEEKQMYSKKLEKYVLQCEMIEEEIKNNEIEFNKQVNSLLKFHDDVIEMQKNIMEGKLY